MEQGDGKRHHGGAGLVRWTGSHGYRYFQKLVPEAEVRGAMLRRKTTRWQLGASPDGQPRDRQPQEAMKSEQIGCKSVLAMCVKRNKARRGTGEPHYM